MPLKITITRSERCTRDQPEVTHLLLRQGYAAIITSFMICQWGGVKEPLLDSKGNVSGELCSAISRT